MKNDYFGKSYADVYDIVYSAKNYEAECDYIITMFAKHCNGRQVKSVLDIACGTGGHAIPLAKRGYIVTAQDQSKEIVQIARKKAIKQGVQITWRPGVAMQKFTLDDRYDSIICMFSSIGYITDDKDLHSTLKNVHGHLSGGGLFIFDYWNRNAVESSYLTKREKIVHDGAITVRRISNTKLDPIKNLARINIHWTTTKDEVIINEGTEIHSCRYYYKADIEAALKTADFKLLDIHPFMDEASAVTNNTWNITIVCCREL